MMLLKKSLLLITFILVSVNVGAAEKGKSWKATKFLKIVFEQKVLSQHLSKEYLYLSQGVRAGRTRNELNQAAENYKKNNEELLQGVEDDYVRSLIEFVIFQAEEYVALIEQPYSVENALIIMDTADVMVEAYSEIFTNIAKDVDPQKIEKIQKVDDAVLAVIRVGKFYLAAKAGISNYNIQSQIQADTIIIDEQLTSLSQDAKLERSTRASAKKALQLWNFARKYVNNLERSNLPIVVDHSTTTIEKDLSRVVLSLLGVV